MVTETVKSRIAKRAAGAARQPTAEEIFLATSMGNEEVVSRIDTGGGGSVTFRHTGSKLVVLYRPVSWGWESVQVASSSMPDLLRNGMRTNCGDCNGYCSPDPMNPTPNACPGREKFATRRCPVCTNGHVVYDYGARKVNTEFIPEAPQDGNEGTDIDDGAYSLATPAARTKADLDRHMLAYHPDEAAALGLRTPTPPPAGTLAAVEAASR